MVYGHPNPNVPMPNNMGMNVGQQPQNPQQQPPTQQKKGAQKRKGSQQNTAAMNGRPVKQPAFMPQQQQPAGYQQQFNQVYQQQPGMMPQGNQMNPAAYNTNGTMPQHVNQYQG